MFYIAQIFGLIALLILVISFQKNDKDELLKYQIFSSLFFSLQYLFLNALTGSLMNIISIIRNVVFRKFNNKSSVAYLIIIVLCMIGLSIFSYNGLISLLPTIAVVLYTFAIFQKNLTITRIVGIISCMLFIIYNINVLAITGLISIIIELIFVIIAIYRFDIRGKLNLVK